METSRFRNEDDWEEYGKYEEINDELAKQFSLFHSDLICRAMTDESIDKYALIKGILQIVENDENDGDDEFTPEVFKNV